MPKHHSGRWLPAEWEPQSAIILTWPHSHSDWQPWLPTVETVYVEMSRLIALHQDLIISCFDESHQQHVKTLLLNADIDLSRVHCYLAESNDSWVRDHGPITVLDNNQVKLLDFRFNGWGNKHESRLDNHISRCLHRSGTFGDTPLESIDLILEGGGIEVDGCGTLLTTRQCQLSPERNPQFEQPKLELEFGRHLGITRVLWLEHGYLAGDDTDSHIDTLARFCDPQTIAYSDCTDPDDEHYRELKAMEKELQEFVDFTGAPYRLIPLPIPEAIYSRDGQRLPATYANFLIINDAVLVPTYQDPADAIALKAIKSGFPDREIIGINCQPLIEQYGSLHCATMQVPAVMQLPGEVR